MKKRVFVLLSVCLLAAACSKEDLYSPAPVSGTWVFSSSNDGKVWTDMNIDKAYYFDGSGKYTVSVRASSAKVSYYNGQVYAEESAFVADNTVYTVGKGEGEKYKFSSFPGVFTLVSSSSSEMVFDYSGSGSVSGYKLSKVTKFAPSATPERPDPAPEDPEPETPSAYTINGTEILEGNDLVGLIYSTADNKGIPGVVVSDGYDCVLTDANGVYQFKSNSLTRLVYYSTPAEYKVATSSSPSLPAFYKEIKPDGEIIRTDFKLEPLAGGKESSWTFVAVGDPQCATTDNLNRYSRETLADIKSTLAGQSSVYAMTLGDITFDSTNMWPTMKASMASVNNGAWYIPFFQTIGNHDHDSLKPDTADDAADDYNATATFVSNFGPTDYSFNRGDVHIVSMDNIPVSNQSSSGKSNGKTWNYGKGFSDSQYNWLKKDIDLVPDRGEKMVFICCHIPFRNASNANFPHCQDVLKLLSEFKEVHIMIGHTHYQQNYVYASYKGKGGLPFYEHIHGSACGAWWTKDCSSTVTGEPSGYTVYEIDGAHIKDWMFKGTRKDADCQFRVFDGDEIYYQSASYPLNWYTASQKAGSASIAVKGNASLKGCFVAQMFDDDDTYWKVELRKKSTGEKIADFTRLANGQSTNVAMSAHYFNKKSKNSTSYTSTTASHYWYCKPASGSPADATDWEVVATHTLPGGTAAHSWKVSELTTEAGLDSAFWF